MAVKERSQIKGTDAQIKAFAGHNGVLAFATDTKSLHVLSGTAGTTTEFLPSTKVATVATSGSYNDLSDKPVVDSALSQTSTNAVQNKVVKSALDGKLSTRGGTVTGDLTVGGALLSGRIDGPSHTAGMLLNYFCGGGESEGAWLSLSGKSSDVERDRGGWRLKAGIPGGSNNYYFSGFSDGSLELNGQPIGHLVARGKSSDGTKWYRKYADGFIEQGGCLSLSPVAGEEYYAINFLIPFTNTNYCGFILPALNDSKTLMFATIGYNRSTPGMTAYLTAQNWPVAGMSAYYVNFFACGF